MRIRYEIILWYSGLLKSIPGKLGCILRNILLPYQKGINVTIWDNVQIDSPSKLIIGNNVSVNRGCILHAGGEIEIGNDVLIGPGVIIYSQNHSYRDLSKKIINQGYNTKKVNIDSNVWIAANAIILPGVTIGEGAVVAAGSVVTKDVEPNTIVGGNPAIFIKIRGSDKIC